MSRSRRASSRILLVTPEITYLPAGMGNMANAMSAKAGGLADVSASLVSALFELGADVHVALPHYRRMFNMDVGKLISTELRLYKRKLPESRIHLAEDRIFYYRDAVYDGYEGENRRIALAFQREVINNIVPRVRPDLIHCNDWMTGLIPSMARRLGIPCLFTVHNIHTRELSLAEIENAGIDAAEFWQHLYYPRMPLSYEETRESNPVDLLASGIFAAHFINTVSPRFLEEIVEGRHVSVPPDVRREISNKFLAGCASGILNAPDRSFNPRIDELLPHCYDTAGFREGKCRNKKVLQRRLGLRQQPEAPLLFWPSRLDPVQKGPQLLTDILYDVISSYWDIGLQLAVVANGAHQEAFRSVVRHHGFYDRVAVCDFDEELSRLGYAASDFMIMPSGFEPCGLPQMISCIYGSLPVVHDTGGLHDTVEHLDLVAERGNGFVFEVWDSAGLRWAVDRAVDFFRQPEDVKSRHIQRIMDEAADRFRHERTARQYFDLYERMLERPLIP